MNFPFGTAALGLLVTAIVAGGWIVVDGRTSSRDARPADLVFATYTTNHVAAYRPVIEQFERDHGVHVDLQLFSERAMTARLQSALAAGAPVPDMVELMGGTLGTFVRGPVEDIQFLDLAARIRSSGLWDRVVRARFGAWTNRGELLALPHDVHPVMLAYRKDLIDALGIDVDELKTWDDFARVGREVTKDLDGDGVPDRYMIDLLDAGDTALRLLILQRGGHVLDAEGRVAFESREVRETIAWYIRATRGKTRIAFPAGWGQTFAQSVTSGLALFYVCPDWRTFQFENDVQGASGKMALMPLPAWTTGGLRTSTWGATAMAFPKRGRRADLAWELTQKLYYDPAALGERFAKLNILPPVADAWHEPQLAAPRPYFGGQSIGLAYAALAPQVPPEFISSYTATANNRLNEAYITAATYFDRNGDAGLDAEIDRALRASADAVRREMSHDRFANETKGER